MDVWDTLECLEMIEDCINCKTSRVGTFKNLGFSNQVMEKGRRILNFIISGVTLYLIFHKVRNVNGEVTLELIKYLTFSGTIYYLISYILGYLIFGGTLFLFCKKKQQRYRKSEIFDREKRNIQVEIEGIIKNLGVLYRQLESSKVPKRYRNYKTVLFLRDVLEEGQGKNLKEAIIIYERYVAENNLYEQWEQDNLYLEKEWEKMQNFSQELEKEKFGVKKIDFFRRLF